jgi:hypothetical protein
MFLDVCFWAHLDPIVRKLINEEIASDLVKLTPSRCQLTEATLTTIPRFVVHRTKPITPTIAKVELADVPFLELWAQNIIQ